MVPVLIPVGHRIKQGLPVSPPETANAINTFQGYPNSSIFKSISLYRDQGYGIQRLSVGCQDTLANVLHVWNIEKS